MAFDIAKYQRERARKLKAAGLCIDCSQPVGVLRSGRVGIRCRTCAKRASVFARKFYAEVRDQGICTKCGTDVAEVNPRTGKKRICCPSCAAARHERRKQNAVVDDHGV